LQTALEKIGRYCFYGPNLRAVCLSTQTTNTKPNVLLNNPFFDLFYLIFSIFVANFLPIKYFVANLIKKINIMTKLYNSESAIRHFGRIPEIPEKIFTFTKYSEMTGYCISSEELYSTNTECPKRIPSDKINKLHNNTSVSNCSSMWRYGQKISFLENIRKSGGAATYLIPQ
jgi:hypothetical protein